MTRVSRLDRGFRASIWTRGQLGGIARASREPEPVLPGCAEQVEDELLIDGDAVALKVMTSSPGAIVLDLAGLDDVEELSVSVFPALGRIAAAAADGELILAAACPTTLAALRRSAPLHVRVFDTCEQAIEAAERAPARRRVARQLPADLHAGRTARRVLDDVCNRWRLDTLRGAALMIVTELATNAVEHAGPPIELCLTTRQQILRIEMSDRSMALPVLSDRCAAGSTTGATRPATGRGPGESLGGHPRCLGPKPAASGARLADQADHLDAVLRQMQQAIFELQLHPAE